MIESVIMLRPRPDWPTRYTPRYSTAPRTGRSAACDGCGPQQARTLAELSRDLDAALRMPGYQMAIAPPIRTRIDMLTTVSTPVGIKVFGEDLTRSNASACRSKACCARCRAPAARSPSGRPAASTSISSRPGGHRALRSHGARRPGRRGSGGWRHVGLDRHRRARGSPSTSAMRPTSDRIRRRFVAFSCQCRRQAASPISAAPMPAPAPVAQAAGMVVSSAAGTSGGMGSMGAGGGQAAIGLAAHRGLAQCR